MKHLLLSLSLCLCSLLPAAIVFQEDFESAAINGTYASEGWVAYRSGRGAAGTTFTDASVSTGDGALLSTSSPINGTRSGTMSGSNLGSPAGNENIGQFFIGVIGLSSDISTLDSFDFSYDFSGGGSSSSSFRIGLAVQDGGSTTWYRSVTEYGGNINVSDVMASHEFSSASWGLWEDPSDGFASAVGGPSSGTTLTSGTVTGVGFVFGANRSSASARIDDISLTAIPEPGTLSLFGLALLGSILLRRRFA